MQFTLKDFSQIDRNILLRRMVPLIWLLGLAVFIVSPVAWTRHKSSVKLHGIQSRIQAANKNVEQLPKLKKEFERLNQQIAQTREALFTEDEIGGFIANVSEIARKHNVLITSSRPKLLEDYIPASLRKFYQAYEFQIDMEAEFHGLGNLLAELYRMPQVFKLQKLDIAGREQEARLNQISLSIIVINAGTGGGKVDQPTGKNAQKPARKVK